MRVLLEYWYVTGATSQPKINSSKLVGLLIGTALTTVFWMTALVFAFHAVGIQASESLITSVGIVIAGLSVVGPTVIMGAR